MKIKLVAGVIGLGGVVVVGLVTYLLISNKINIGYNTNYEPEQPIPYSHKLHAGKLGIDCKYCHNNVEVSRHAAIPPLSVCMNCHQMVRTLEGETEPSPHIEKLVDAYQNNESIEWVKVHLLPDHVKFNHAPHIKAGKQCQECHGPIEEMDVVKQFSSLSMGWCVNCHREAHSEENLEANINCGTCHY